jgi:hypothetical protein
LRVQIEQVEQRTSKAQGVFVRLLGIVDPVVGGTIRTQPVVLEPGTVERVMPPGATV